MELIEGSETSANHNRTPGKYPKEYLQKPILFWVLKTQRNLCLKNCHLHVPIVMNLGSLNLLEVLGSVQGCNGIALTFTRNVRVLFRKQSVID